MRAARRFFVLKVAALLRLFLRGPEGPHHGREKGEGRGEERNARRFKSPRDARECTNHLVPSANASILRLFRGAPFVGSVLKRARARANDIDFSSSPSRLARIYVPSSARCAVIARRVTMSSSMGPIR